MKPAPRSPRLFSRRKEEKWGRIAWEKRKTGLWGITGEVKNFEGGREGES